MYQIKVPHHMQDGLRNGDYQLKPMILTNCKCRHCTKAKTNNRCYYAQAREPGRGSSRFLKEEMCTCPHAVEQSCLKRNTKANCLYKCFPGAGMSGRSNNHYYMPSDSYDREDSYECSLPPLIDEGAYWSKRLASLTDFSHKVSPSPPTLSSQQEDSMPVMAQKVDKGIEAHIFQDGSSQEMGRYNATNNTVQFPEVYKRLPNIRPKSANLELFKEKNLLNNRKTDPEEMNEALKMRLKTPADLFPTYQVRRGVEEKGTEVIPQVTKMNKATMVEKKPRMPEITISVDNQQTVIKERVENVDGFPLQDFYKLLDNVPSTFFASTHLMNSSLRRSPKKSSRLYITPSKNKDWKTKLWGKLKQLNHAKGNDRVKRKSRSKSLKLRSSHKKKVHRHHRHKKTYSKFTSTTTINAEKIKETHPLPTVPLQKLLPNIT